jgi:hypothetical protein
VHDPSEQPLLDRALPRDAEVRIEAGDPAPRFIEVRRRGLVVPLRHSLVGHSHSLAQLHRLERRMVVHAPYLVAQPPDALDLRLDARVLSLLGEVEHERQVVREDNDLPALRFFDEALGM